MLDGLLAGTVGMYAGWPVKATWYNLATPAAINNVIFPAALLLRACSLYQAVKFTCLTDNDSYSWLNGCIVPCRDERGRMAAVSLSLIAVDSGVSVAVFAGFLRERAGHFLQPVSQCLHSGCMQSSSNGHCPVCAGAQLWEL